MSSIERQEVWRVPMKYCGIVREHFGEPCGAVGEGYDPDCVLDFEELKEEYAELFDYDMGKFNPSGCACSGAYLDFVLYEECDYTWYATGEYRGTPKSVFEQMLPDIDLGDVHCCEYEWYNSTEAPEQY